MLVFWNQRLVILSVPKTGTTALQRALAARASIVMRHPPQLKHSPLHRYRRMVEPLLATGGEASFETLAVIREPVDWLSSWYRYRSRDDLRAHPNSTAGMTFDAFVEAYADRRRGSPTAVGSQARFALNEDGSQGVTHLFRFEQPERLIAFLSERLGGSIELSRLNVSPVLEVALSPGLRDRLVRQRPEEFLAWEMAGA